MKDSTNNTDQHNKNMQSYLFAVILFFILVSIDQYVKHLVVTHMELYSKISVWDDVFEILYIQNKGAAWGLFQNKQIIFVISCIIVFIIGIVFYITCVKKGIFKDLRILVILIMSGGIGNLIDRICYQYVIDFLYFKLIDFPVFNVADCYVTVGFILLLILVLFKYKDEDFKVLKFNNNK